MPTPNFDTQEAHKHFSASCFNQAWDLIDKAERTPEENEEMIHLVHSSIWHWTKRADCEDKNLSIGYWQASRVYVLAGEGANAKKYADLCLAKTPKEDPFLLGYAYEALARAEANQGHSDQAKAYHEEAANHAEQISDENSREMLLNDLKEIL